jgi:hypothetical protein
MWHLGYSRKYTSADDGFLVVLLTILSSFIVMAGFMVGAFALHVVIISALIWVVNLAATKAFAVAMLPFKIDIVLGLGLHAVRALFGFVRGK